MKGMVDVCVGPMLPKEIINEIHFRLSRSPRRLVIDIRKQKKGEEKYPTTIYITKKDFEGKNQKEEK